MTTDIAFHISDAAKNRITELQSELKNRKNLNVVIPAILWVHEQKSGKYLIRSGVALGFYHDEDEAGDLMEVNGLKIALAVPDDELERFIGKTLDYIDGALILT